jgi:hypothetical protein
MLPAAGSSSSYSTLSDSYMLRAAAAANAAGASGMQQASFATPAANGNLSRGGSHSSLSSLQQLPSSTAAAAAAGASGSLTNGRGGAFDHSAVASLHTGGLLTGGLAAAALGSSMPGSNAGSGPPSTTSGALSHIQAHAEGSQRAAANMRLLQASVNLHGCRPHAMLFVFSMSVCCIHHNFTTLW